MLGDERMPPLPPDPTASIPRTYEEWAYEAARYKEQVREKITRDSAGNYRLGREYVPADADRYRQVDYMRGYPGDPRDVLQELEYLRDLNKYMGEKLEAIGRDHEALMQAEERLQKEIIALKQSIHDANRDLEAERAAHDESVKFYEDELRQSDDTIAKLEDELESLT